MVSSLVEKLDAEESTPLKTEVSESVPASIKLLGLSQRLGSLGTRISETAISAVFMGLIDDEVLQRWDTYPHHDAQQPEDLLDGMGDGLSPWEVEMKEAANLDHLARILVIGAGGGREAVALHREGYTVEGLEHDEALCELTRQAFELRGIELPIRNEKRFELNAEKNSYDAIFIGRYLFSYIRNSENRIEFLQKLSHCLVSDGAFLFSYFTRPDDPSESLARAFRVQAPVANFIRTLRGRGKHPVETGDHLDPHSPLMHHHFTEKEIEAEIAHADFRTARVGEFEYGDWMVARNWKQ